MKIVVVPQFKPGDDMGNVPGEFQFWVEREKLDRVWPLPPSYRDLRSNADGKGDNLAAMTYWHGRLMNAWANQLGAQRPARDKS